MGYLVLARKYRPQTFDEVYAQEQVTVILKNAIEMNRIAHSYLFTGPRGVGKTSMARIFAKSLNCVEGPTGNPCNVCRNCVEITKGISNDVIEIDGASNTGVDDIRDLQKELMYTPSSSKFKIYIIDEVHMLSKNAFNALLKTLEEPPDNVIFIFATTEPHKVLPTIISRCQRYDFKRIPIESIVKRLESICDQEHIKVENEAFYFIARKADGGMRDALSLLDQVLSLGKNDITVDDVLSVFGIVHNDIYFDVIKFIQERNPAGIFALLHQILEKGYDLQEFLNGLLDWIRNVLLVKINFNSNEIPSSYISSLIEIAKKFTENELLYILTYLVKTKIDMRNSENPLLIAEMSFIKLTKLAELHPVEEILKHISEGNINISQNNEDVDKKEEKPKVPVKTQVRKIERNIIKEAQSEKETVVNITKEHILREWDQLYEKIKKEMPLNANFFKTPQINNIANNFIHFECDSHLAHNRLTANKSLISSIFSKFFNSHIKVDFIYKPAPKEEIIKNPSIQDLKEENPLLVEFMKRTDSILSQF